MWVCRRGPYRPGSCRYCPISLLRGHHHRLVWVIRRFGDDTAFWIATPPTRRSVRCIAICLPTTAPSRCPAGSGSAHGLLDRHSSDPTLSPLYRDLLAHYGAVALSGRVREGPPARAPKPPGPTPPTQHT